MPRAAKMGCAYAEAKPRPKAPKPKLTDEEKAAAKVIAAEKAETRRKKKDWEAKLKPQSQSTSFAMGTKVMFKSDAKSPYGLNDKDIASLPFYSFPGSPKCVVRVSDAEQLAARKRTAIGVDYPAMNPLHSYMSGTRVMTLNGRHLTELSGYTPYRSRGYGY